MGLRGTQLTGSIIYTLVTWQVLVPQNYFGHFQQRLPCTIWVDLAFAKPQAYIDKITRRNLVEVCILSSETTL
jgi:hypothetical protein